MIRAENVSKIFRNGFKAVDRVSLDVSQGDVFGFLGPNGAGKTTTIRMLTGVYAPSSGTIVIDGKDLHKEPTAVKRVIGVLPESSGYYEWMTGGDYLNYFGRLFGMSGDKIAARAKTLMRDLGLAGKEDVPVKHYSRGMRQRLGIAKALIHSPTVLFLDEPTLGLDPAGQREIHDLLSDLSRNMAVTIFITTHLLKDVDTLCNRVALIDHGTVVEQGDIETLRRRYARANVLRLRATNNETAMKALNGVRCVTAAEALEDGVRLTVQPQAGEPPQRAKNEILQRLLAEDVDIREFREDELTVEDLFFAIIGRSRKGGK